VASSADGGGRFSSTVPARVGAAFRLLMQLRTFTAVITLLLLPKHQINGIVLLVSLAALSWIAAQHWRWIVPLLLRYPVLVAVDVAVSFTVLEIGGPTGPFFLATVVTVAVAGLLFRLPGMLTASALQVLWYYLTFAAADVPDGAVTFQSVIGQPAYYPLIGFAGVALRKLIDDQAAAESRAAASEERARLAREMHDSLAKTLRGVALSAAALPMWVRGDSERAIEEAGRLASAVEIASREARGLISGLRDDSVTLPLSDAVSAIVDKWHESSGINVQCELDSSVDLRLRARYEMVAICSEALTNIARHAEATSVSIRLTATGKSVALTISDDGKGFQMTTVEDLARAGHYGLLGLRERAERAGGALSVTAAPGAGTTLNVTMPLEGAFPDDFHAVEVV
jgi:signal transduction histidine kinase